MTRCASTSAGSTTWARYDAGDFGTGDATTARYEIDVQGEPTPVLLVDVDRESNPDLTRPTHGPQRIVPADARRRSAVCPAERARRQRREIGRASVAPDGAEAADLPYPPDLVDDQPPTVDFGDLVDAVVVDVDWAGERAPGSRRDGWSCGDAG